MTKERLPKIFLNSITVIAGAIFLLAAAGCSVEYKNTPEVFTKKFIQKYIPHLDLSVASFYLPGEQAGIKEKVSLNIAAKKEDGTYESLKKAVYDFSNVNVTVVAQKEDYVNDEEKDLVEVKVSGSYTMTMNGEAQTVAEDNLFVLQGEGKEWKVTNKIKPWM